MEPIMPDPDHITPDAFDRITCGLPVLTPFATLFAEAEELLLATRPEGFEVEEIGLLAFEELPVVERDAAMRELVYTYWSARQSDREALARYEATGGQR